MSLLQLQRKSDALRNKPRHHQGRAGPKVIKVLSVDDIAAVAEDRMQHREWLPRAGSSG